MLGLVLLLGTYPQRLKKHRELCQISAKEMDSLDKVQRMSQDPSNGWDNREQLAADDVNPRKAHSQVATPNKAGQVNHRR
jgi:hypothetical protein